MAGEAKGAKGKEEQKEDETDNSRHDDFNKPVHGTIPQNLIEKIVRMRIYESQYWKEHCFGLTAELLVDKAVGLKYFGGVSSETSRPSPFLCLLMKMLQMKPELEVILALIHNEDFKYMRILGIFYLRLVGTPFQIYRELEALYTDFRKVRYQLKNGWKLMHVDEVVDELLNDSIVCNIVLPRLPNRILLVESGKLAQRISILENEIEPDEQLTVKELLDVDCDDMSLSSFSDDNETALKSGELFASLETNPKKKRKKKQKVKKKRVIKGLKTKNLVSIENKVPEGEQNSNSSPNNSSSKVKNDGTEEFSAEYWNEQRKKLGLKPLQ